MPVTNILQEAIAHHQAGHLSQAEVLYRQILQIEHHHPDALHFLGIIALQMGNNETSIQLIRMAIQVCPSDPVCHINLGNALKKQGNFDAAAESYQQALARNPDAAEAHFNLGVTLKILGKLDAAVESYRKALSLRPDFADAYLNLGATLKELGRLDEALACFQQVVALTPENDMARHLLASLSGNNTERAPVQYVEKVFDDYANKFDEHLVQVLKYETPEKLIALVTQHATPPAEKWNVLDLGCGTGLVGAAIAPHARQLVGVDLSAKMLEKAQARKLYKRLVRSDLLAMMREEKASSYDVIFAADVFIYIGKLNEIVGEIKRLLRPNGMFAFSVEALEVSSDGGADPDTQREYQLQNTGRYAQSTPYLNRLAAANGFSLQEMAATQIRMEGSKPIHGHLLLWKS
jgi:predicted TPR repeat methyltransferase